VPGAAITVAAAQAPAAPSAQCGPTVPDLRHSHSGTGFLRPSPICGSCFEKSHRKFGSQRTFGGFMAAIASGYVNSALCKSKYACPLRVAFLRPTPHHRNTDYRLGGAFAGKPSRRQVRRDCTGVRDPSPFIQHWPPSWRLTSTVEPVGQAVDPHSVLHQATS
jgi:hypothetical protein